MLRSIERSHSAIVLRPDTQVQKRLVGSLAGDQQFPGVTPIHTNEMNRTILAVPFQKAESLAQEAGKFGFGHFAGCHCKFAMADCAISANISINLYVVRRIGEYDVCSLSIHESRID